MNITVAQLVDWIVQHRKGKAFNYKRDIIQQELCQSISDGVFAYHEVEGQIQGVVCGRKDTRQHTIHIYDILTSQQGVIQKFMERFKLVYPGWSLEGRRKGKLVQYNTDKLTRRICVR